jgi:hypothetical protein
MKKEGESDGDERGYYFSFIYKEPARPRLRLYYV